MAFRVEITEKALADIESTYLWLLEQSSEAAPRWYIGLLDAIFSLEAFPARCMHAPENEFLDTEVRQLLYGKRGGVYRVLFEIQVDVVFVLRVRHGAQVQLTSKEWEE